MHRKGTTNTAERFSEIGYRFLRYVRNFLWCFIIKQITVIEPPFLTPMSFGSDIVDENGVIDRRLLGRKVFGRENHSQMQKLEAIVWPEIWKMAQEKIAFMWKKQNKNVIIVDAAVLLQAGWKENVNQLWVSIVDTETAVQRIVQRDARTEEEARQRLSNQISNNQYVQEANVVFCSKWEISYTQKQVDKAWEYTQKTYIQE